MRPGSVVLNPVGTEHSVWTKEGCVVLIQWELPVIILGEDEMSDIRFDIRQPACGLRRRPAGCAR